MLTILSKKSSVVLIIILSLLIFHSFSAYCNSKPRDYFQNHQPVWKQKPTFIRSHQYGKLYQIGTGSTKMNLIHVYGNSYQMGFAHGFLLKDKLNSFVPELFQYLDSQFQQALPKWIPKFLLNKAINFSLKTALDLTYQITKPYTNKKYYLQMRGIADASGINYKDLRRVHMIGQLTKGSCSMFGAWGNATSNNQTVQLRALDWDFDGPFRKYPLVVVYHPSDKQKYGNLWLNVGFAGWVGVLSGVNEHKMGVSQIGVYFNDQTFGKQSRVGNPFTFVLRDVLQWDKNIEESIHRMKTTKRTCNLILGVGDGKNQSNYFRGFQYSHSTLNVVNDSNPLPNNITWHYKIDNTVYWGMDWNCPAWNLRLAEMLSKYHGEIDAQNTMKYILPGLNSGNLQTVIYDLSYEWVYFAYGYIQQDQQGRLNKIDAFKRPYIGINLKQIFNEKL